MELDKAHQEIDILREKMERNQGESRRVSTSDQSLKTSDIWLRIVKVKSFIFTGRFEVSNDFKTNLNIFKQFLIVLFT